MVLPGSAIGLLGGGENSRLFAQTADRMGYRVEVLSSYGDLDRVREFAGSVDVVTVVSSDVPAIALEAAAASSALVPSVKTLAAAEERVGVRRDPEKQALVDLCIIGARSAGGSCVFYDPIAIDRVDGAVDIARMPAPVGYRVRRNAEAMTRDILEELDVVGVACAEFTLNGESGLVVHDVTPHPCVPGYLTLDACVTSHFEQQLRAVCGLPPGSTKLLRPAAMAVLRSDVADFSKAAMFPSVKLYRGHLTAVAASATQAKQIVLAARK